MGLSNTQYDTIMRQYSKRQLENRRLLEHRRRLAYEKIPQLAQIDRQVSSESVSCARSLLEDGADGTAALKERLRALSSKRAQLLKENGFPEDYLQMHYTCPDCQDTGYQNGVKCHCLRQSAIDLFYTQSGMKEILAEENFSHFSYHYYPEDLIHPAPAPAPET